MATLDELLAGESQDQIKARLLAGLNTAGFPVTDWHSGAVERTNVEAFTLVLNDLTATAIPSVARSGFAQLASRDWLTIVARYWFQLERTEATYTKQKLLLTCSPGTGPYTLNPGEMIAESAAGNRYILDEAGVVPTYPTAGISLTFKAESPGGSYADGANTIIALVTPLPGLTVDNPAPDFTAVTRAGYGSGTIALSETVSASPLPSNSVRVRIETSGQVAAGTFSYSVNGAAYVTGGTIGTTFDIPGTNIRMTFANGAVNPSFFATDVYSFSTPGTPVVQQGVDAESDATLQARCVARWASLSAIPTEDRYALWARVASVEVTKVKVAASSTVGGQVDVTIAGRVNPIGGSVVTTVQTFIDARDGITDLAVVQAAAAVAIATGGTVKAPSATLATVQSAAQAKWDQYIADLPIGGSLPDGVVRLEELTEAIMTSGATDVENLTLRRLTIDAAGSPVNAVLTGTQVAATSSTLAASLTWLPL